MAAEDTRDTEVEAEIRDTEMEARIAEISNLETIEVVGETEINDDVIGAIAGIAAREIEGVPRWAPTPYAGPSVNGLAAVNGSLEGSRWKPATGKPYWTST